MKEAIQPKMKKRKMIEDALLNKGRTKEKKSTEEALLTD